VESGSRGLTEGSCPSRPHGVGKQRFAVPVPVRNPSLEKRRLTGTRHRERGPCRQPAWESCTRRNENETRILAAGHQEEGSECNCRLTDADTNAPVVDPRGRRVLPAHRGDADCIIPGAPEWTLRQSERPGPTALLARSITGQWRATRSSSVVLSHPASWCRRDLSKRGGFRHLERLLSAFPPEREIS